MLNFLGTRAGQGMRTTGFPDGPPPEFPERFRGRPTLDSGRCPSGCRECAGGPTSLFRTRPDGRVELDVGACLFAPEEVAACPHGALRFTHEYRLAASAREQLWSPTGEIALAGALAEETRRLFGRSLRLRSVSAGSCNGCEGELVALGNVVFDLARFGIQFVASPRHADGIVVTGAVSSNMRLALERTYAAIPAPKLVIAVGACAINGGPFRGSPEVNDGIEHLFPVDLWVAGCPPHPITLLDGLLRLLGRIRDRSRPPPAIAHRDSPPGE